jgi:hypothetical protein
MNRKDTGANFQIVVDGNIRSHVLKTAIDPAMFLKERHPQSEIVVRT